MASARRLLRSSTRALLWLALAEPVYMGGQAVMEGVMMRGKDSWAVAVRKADGSIALRTETQARFTDRHHWARLPLLRGVMALGESLKLGYRALSWSANQTLPEDEKPVGKGQMAAGLSFGLIIFLGLFVALPLGLSRLVERRLHTSLASSLVEGAIRMAVFVGYLLLVSAVKDIRRLFQFHGAEHKAIAAYEAADVMTPEAADRYSTRHVRCGTNFLLLVMMLTIVAYSFLGRPAWWIRILERIVLIPLVAGVAFELIRLAARSMRFPVVRWLMAPGLALQRITTRHPNLDQLEVALASFDAVMTADQRAEVAARVDLGAPHMRWVGAAIPA